MDRRIARSAGGFRGTGDLETQIPPQDAKKGKSLTLMEAFSPYGTGKWPFSRGYLGLLVFFSLLKKSKNYLFSRSKQLKCGMLIVQ